MKFLFLDTKLTFIVLVINSLRFRIKLDQDK